LERKASLLYYPTALILLRGFKVEFKSSQNWTFDYKKTFTGSTGGEVRVFGIRFASPESGGKTSEKDHKIDKAGTVLTMEDDPDTIRFVGYAVTKNTVFEKQVVESLEASLTKQVVEALDKKGPQ
jgi:hypothetical protein